jgi:hypothetical protein
MIELQVNGRDETIEPSSVRDLHERIREAVPTGHGICRMAVNGREIGEPDLESHELADVRRVEVETQSLRDLAHQSIGETRDWISRICGVLDSVASDYRTGREQDGARRLVNVVDALQVLVPLLRGIHENLRLQEHENVGIDEPWARAELELRDSVEDLAGAIETGDPVRLADKTGYRIPRCLASFNELLGQIPS